MFLSEAQQRALRFYEAEGKLQGQMQRPHANTVKVLVRDGLLTDLRLPKLTDRAKDALAHIEPKGRRTSTRCWK